MMHFLTKLSEPNSLLLHIKRRVDVRHEAMRTFLVLDPKQPL